MTALLRRYAALFLLLAVPLRVYAAVAMMTCGTGEATMAMDHDGPCPSMQMQMQAETQMQMPMEADGHEAMPTHARDVHDVHDVHDGHAAAADHLSCAACCCTGMIATSRFDWQPRSFATPPAPAFVASPLPGVVPGRLERPPRSFPA